MTVAVFVGFGYLLWNDIATNLNDKLYTFTVGDKLMSAQQCSDTEINFGTHNQSLNLIFGIDPNLPFEEKQSFEVLDNDYIRIVLFDRLNSQEALKRGGKSN